MKNRHEKHHQIKSQKRNHQKLGFLRSFLVAVHHQESRFHHQNGGVSPSEIGHCSSNPWISWISSLFYSRIGRNVPDVWQLIVPFLAVLLIAVPAATLQGLLLVLVTGCLGTRQPHLEVKISYNTLLGHL